MVTPQICGLGAWSDSSGGFSDWNYNPNEAPFAHLQEFPVMQRSLQSLD